MGRKTKLTKRVQDDICAAIEMGANVEMRCVNGEISTQTYFTWIKRGETARELVAKGQPVETEEVKYIDFLDAIGEAAAIYGRDLQLVIASNARRDPIEARRELQRLFPADYAPPPQRTELTGKDGGPVEIRTIEFVRPELKGDDAT